MKRQHEGFIMLVGNEKAVTCSNEAGGVGSIPRNYAAPAYHLPQFAT